MPEDTKKLVAELERRKRFFEGERSRLAVESVTESSPTRRFNLEEHKREALEELETIQKVLDKIQDSSVIGETSPINEQQSQNTISQKKVKKHLTNTGPDITKSAQSTKYRPTHEWYKGPIGIIGLTVFSGILIVLAVYLIRIHFGIPL